jgi:hypothetical protein
MQAADARFVCFNALDAPLHPITLQHELAEFLLYLCWLSLRDNATWWSMWVSAGSSAIVVSAILTYFAFFMLPYVHSHSIPEGSHTPHRS